MAFKDKKVLIVEDYLPNREMMADMFELFDMEVDFVEDGDTAISQITGTQYDLVFLDLQLPIVSGFDVAKEVRRVNDQTVLIALTASALTESRRQCLDVGMNDYLTKPVVFDDIKSILNKYLGN